MVFQRAEDAVKQLPTLTDRAQGQSATASGAKVYVVQKLSPPPKVTEVCVVQDPSHQPEYPRVYVSLRKPSRATPGSKTPAWDAVKAGNRGDGRRERREKCF